MKLDIEKAFEILKPFCLSKKLIEPWSFTEEALENTLKYITALSYNCYIYNGKQLYKLEFKTTSPLLKKHLTSRNISTKIRETLKKYKNENKENKENDKLLIITERSLYTDKMVFSKMFASSKVSLAVVL
jgi:hypothetical protein